MTDLIIGLSRPTTFGSQTLKPEIVFRSNLGNAVTQPLFRTNEMRHSKSEDLLGTQTPRSPSPLITTAASEDDLIASTALNNATTPVGNRIRLPKSPPGSPGVLADRVDPEDSIRDIVTENDLYR